jgi:replicative DNA helicase
VVNEQTLPHSIDSERAVLGSILLENEHIYDAAAAISSEDFYLDSHRTIFGAMLEMSDEGKPIDDLTLSELLRGKKKLEAIGGASYICGLSDGQVRRKSIDSYVSSVREQARRRQLIHGLNASLAAAFDPGVRTREITSSIEDTLLQIEADSQKTKAQHVADFSVSTMDELIRLSKADGQVVGLESGIPELDHATTGFRPGELTIIGGRPGMGKSSLALQACMANAEKGIPTKFFSLEMTKEECLRRLWAAHSGVFYFRLHDPRELDEHHWMKLRNTMAAVAEWPLYIDESASLTHREIAARARIAIRRHGVKLVIVDYLQIVDAEGKDERSKLTKISKTMRQLAKNEHVPVIALSQLSRPKDQSENARPTMYHLKESGSLEADAHNILLPFRPKEGSKYNGKDELLIAKQRNGPIGSVDVEYCGGTLTFKERA